MLKRAKRKRNLCTQKSMKEEVLAKQLRKNKFRRESYKFKRSWLNSWLKYHDKKLRDKFKWSLKVIKLNKMLFWK